MAKANDDSVLTVENSQTLLEVPINISTVEINGADIVIDRMVVNDNVNLYINNTATIGEYYQLSGETRIFLANDSILYLNSYKGNTFLKGNISIKYHDGIIHKSPRFDHIEGYYIKYGEYDEASGLIISDNTVDFNELTSSLICQREEIQRNVVSGLIQNEDIETITYDADSRIYTVTLNENINREYLAIELLFNLNQWGNTIAYKSVDTEGNDIDNTDYSFNLPNSRINASLFDEGISYLILAIPNENYVPFSIKVYDPYDENNYRYINVVLKQIVIPEPAPEPVPLPAPETVQSQEPAEISVKPVVNTCAK